MLFSWRRRRRGRKKCETRLLKKLRSINELSMRNERSTLRLTRLITEKERRYLLPRAFILLHLNFLCSLDFHIPNIIQLVVWGSYTWLIKRSFIKRQTNSIGKQ